MKLDVALYSLTETATAVDMEVGRLRGWDQKGYIGFSKADTLAPVAGATTLITMRTVLQIAVALYLTRYGLHPNDACAAARYFSDISDSNEAPGFMRNPGETFPKGNTGLVAWHGLRRAKVFRFDGQTIPSPFAAHQIASQRSAVVLWLDPIVNDVTSELSRIDKERV